ncbi:MAG: thioredoxin domain-containing protein [Candidatus Thorarchaeota archaeon]
MILLFTSDHCAWCDIVKSMLDTECEEFEDPCFVLEINVDKHSHIAEAYGILVVPTLVSRGCMLSGVPCQEDLRSFLLQSIAGRPLDREESRAQTVLKAARRKRATRLSRVSERAQKHKEISGAARVQMTPARQKQE